MTERKAVNLAKQFAVKAFSLINKNLIEFVGPEFMRSFKDELNMKITEIVYKDIQYVYSRYLKCVSVSSVSCTNIRKLIKDYAFISVLTETFVISDAVTFEDYSENDIFDELRYIEKRYAFYISQMALARNYDNLKELLAKFYPNVPEEQYETINGDILYVTVSDSDSDSDSEI